MSSLSNMRMQRLSSSAAFKPSARIVPSLKPLGCRTPVRLVSLVRAEPESSTTDQDLMSDAERKKAQAEKLRAAEKFMVKGGAKAVCKGCGYEYSPDKGDPEFPVPKGVKFIDLPEDYNCPVCGAQKKTFNSEMTVVAGFAENQSYGLGTNTMTGDQKQLLIYGSLLLFFILFIAGYGLE